MEDTDRHRVDAQPRSATDREWAVFLRETETDPLRHVGSVTAPDADVAHEQATTLFGDGLTDIWVCPATALTRFVSDGVETETRADSGEAEG